MASFIQTNSTLATNDISTNASDHYVTDKTGMEQFVTNIYNVTGFSDLFNNTKGEAVLSCKLLGFRPKILTPQINDIPIGDTSVSVVTPINTDCHRVYNTINGQTYSIDTLNGTATYYYELPYNSTYNWLNKKKYRQLILFLPFLGWYNMDKNCYYEKGMRIKLKAFFNPNTSTISYYIYGQLKHDDTHSMEYEIIDVASGEVGVEIPFTYSNNASVMRNNMLSLIGLGVGAIGSIATANPLPLLATGLGTVKSISNNIERFSNSKSGGSLPSINIISDILLLEIKSQNSTSINDIKNIYGLPSRIRTKLNNIGLNNYAKIGDCHLNINNCTKEEYDEIYGLLKEGVII